jgi:NifU-like protein
MHCSVMGAEAMRAAIANFKGEALADDDHDEGALICKCFGVGQGMLERTIRTNALTTLSQVVDYTKAGGSCATCHQKIEDVLLDVNAEMVAEGALPAESVFTAARSTSPAVAAPAEAAGDRGDTLSLVERILIVQKAIDELRPVFIHDGGDLKLVDVADDIVTVKLSGTCANCEMSSATLHGLREKLVPSLGRSVRVVPETAVGAFV